MRIIQVPRRFVTTEWGGTETVILETSKRLLRLGHDTEIYCPNALAESNAEILDGLDIQRFPYVYPFWGLSEENKRLLDMKGGNLFSFELMKAMKKTKPLDVIHAHTGKRLGGICRYVAKKRKVPYVISLHGGVFDVPAMEAQQRQDPIKGTVEWGKLLGMWVGSRKVLSDAAGVICVGKQEAIKAQKELPQTKVYYLPNGVDPDSFSSGNGAEFRNKLGIGQDKFVLTTIGRIDPQKNQKFLLKMLPELLKIQPKTHLVFIGHVTNEAYYGHLERSIKKQGFSDSVTLIPGLDTASNDLIDAYHGSDLFVLPSIHEPFGIVILEAWASGLPVLASRVGGIPYFVNDGDDGLLYDSNNREQFIAHFKLLVEKPELLKSLAQKGHDKSRREYSWDRITDNLVDIYNEVILDHSKK